jgi:uncharacterized membrane protein
MYPEAEPAQSTSTHRLRIDAIDLARGVALVAMAIYHFTWDLELFGYIPAGTTGDGGWRLFARCIATSFLFLVGVSLFLAHARGVKWRSFGRRLAMVAAAAALITAATYYAVPNAFIYFGILHQIAIASLLGLLFLRMPALLTLAVAVFSIAGPHFLRTPLLDHPALLWIGLSTYTPRSNDFVPMFPWFGPVLLGIAAAKLATAGGVLDRLAGLRPGRWSRPLRFAGQHSLAFYLIHQPVLLSLVWVASQFLPASEDMRNANFTAVCQRQCLELRDEAFCQAYCLCMLDRLEKEGVLDEAAAGSMTEAINEKVLQTAALCTAETESLMFEGESE